MEGRGSVAESAFRLAPVGLLLSAVACAVVPSRWGFAGGEGLEPRFRCGRIRG